MNFTFVLTIEKYAYCYICMYILLLFTVNTHRTHNREHKSSTNKLSEHVTTRYVVRHSSYISYSCHNCVLTCRY